MIGGREAVYSQGRNMSVFIFASLRCLPEHSQALRDAMRGMQRDSLAEAGCEVYQVLQEEAAADVLHVFERYRDMAAVEAHRACALPGLPRLGGRQAGGTGGSETAARAGLNTAAMAQLRAGGRWTSG
jgi:quinol monooxygenase YgiN